MKDLKMNDKHVALSGEDHGSIISKGMPEIYRFFNQHSNPASR
jgi:hypothetical protein